LQDRGEHQDLLVVQDQQELQEVQVRLANQEQQDRAVLLVVPVVPGKVELLDQADPLEVQGNQVLLDLLAVRVHLVQMVLLVLLVVLDPPDKAELQVHLVVLANPVLLVLLVHLEQMVLLDLPDHQDHPDKTELLDHQEVLDHLDNRGEQVRQVPLVHRHQQQTMF
jgi:hypothetical protein